MLMASSFGAVTPVSAYQQKAIALAMAATAPHQVVAVNIGAGTGRVFEYWSQDAAADAYGELAGEPGAYVYVALIRSGEVIEEAYFAGKETDTVVTTTTKSKIPWGYIAAGLGLAVAVGGAIYVARR